MTPRRVAEGLLFAEGPRWYDGRLWLADMIGHSVAAVGLDGNVEIIQQFDQETSGIGFLPNGTPIVVLRESKHLVALHDGGFSVHADLSHVPCDMLNDMVVDRHGRAYVDAMRLRKPSPEDVGESIVVVGPEGRVEQTVGGVINPNGIAIFPSGRELVLAETFARRLTVFEIADDGALGERRLYAELGDILPDGICCDADGAVWVSSISTSEFVRIEEGGTITDSVSVRPRWGVACAFGGDDRRSLFLLSAETSFETLRQPDGTRSFIDVVEPGRTGGGWP